MYSASFSRYAMVNDLARWLSLIMSKQVGAVSKPLYAFGRLSQSLSGVRFDFEKPDESSQSVTLPAPLPLTSKSDGSVQDTDNDGHGGSEMLGFRCGVHPFRHACRDSPMRLRWESVSPWLYVFSYSVFSFWRSHSKKGRELCRKAQFC